MIFKDYPPLWVIWWTARSSKETEFEDEIWDMKVLKTESGYSNAYLSVLHYDKQLRRVLSCRPFNPSTARIPAHIRHLQRQVEGAEEYREAM